MVLRICKRAKQTAMHKAVRIAANRYTASPVFHYLAVESSQSMRGVPRRRTRSGEAERHDQDERKEEVVCHGMRPAGGVFQILADPQQQDRRNHRKLTGDYQKCVAQVAALVQRLHLVGCQVALFGGKQGICHRVLFAGLDRDLRDRRSYITIQSHGAGAAPAFARAGCRKGQKSGLLRRISHRLRVQDAAIRRPAPASRPHPARARYRTTHSAPPTPRTGTRFGR